MKGIQTRIPRYGFITVKNTGSYKTERNPVNCSREPGVGDRLSGNSVRGSKILSPQRKLRLFATIRWNSEVLVLPGSPLSAVGRISNYIAFCSLCDLCNFFCANLDFLREIDVNSEVFFSLVVRFRLFSTEKVKMPRWSTREWRTLE